MESQCPLPHSQKPALFRGFFECVVTWLLFYNEELLAHVVCPRKVIKCIYNYPPYLDASRPSEASRRAMQ
jgi:hypothetical protein